MSVTQIIVGRVAAVCAQINWAERDSLPFRVHSGVPNIGASGDQNRVLKQVIRRAVFLEYDHNMLDRAAYRAASVLN